MSVIAFDYDGVIADTLAETYLMGKTAYEDMTGKKMIVERVFNKARPFIKTAEDYLSVQMLLERHKSISFQSIRDVQKKSPDTHAEFAKRFYAARGKLIKNPKVWFRCFAMYNGIVKLIKKLLKSNKIFIATARDKESTSKVLKHAGIRIDSKNIIDRYFSKDKLEQAKHIASVTGAKLNEIVFIDDIIDQLKPLYSAGVRTILASWGYSTPKYIAEAKKLGMPVASLDDIEKTIDFTAKAEYFDVVNEKDEVIGCAPRQTCHKLGLMHRAVHIILLNSKGEILLQKRSMSKDLYPGWWIDAAAGHVDAGEDYDESAKREAKEELGIDVKLEKLFKYKKKDVGKNHIDNETIILYIARSDGPFKVPEDEVQFVQYFQPEQVLKMLKTEKFTPGTVAAYEEISKRPELLKRLGLS